MRTFSPGVYFSPPRVPRVRSRRASTPFNSSASDAFELRPDVIASYDGPSALSSVAAFALLEASFQAPTFAIFACVFLIGETLAFVVQAPVNAVILWSGAFYTLVPIRPRRRGERRSLRTLAVVSLRPGSLAFNTRPRRLSTPLLTPMNSTPISSLCMERPSVPPGTRPLACSMTTVLVHAFGDVPTPPLFGAALSATGRRRADGAPTPDDWRRVLSAFTTLMAVAAVVFAAAAPAARRSVDYRAAIPATEGGARSPSRGGGSPARFYTYGCATARQRCTQGLHLLLT